MDIDKEIEKLTVERSWLKMQINSTYGTNMSKSMDLFDIRDKITMELKKLHLIKNRKIKLDKIIQRNEKRIEVEKIKENVK